MRGKRHVPGMRFEIEIRLDKLIEQLLIGCCYFIVSQITKYRNKSCVRLTKNGIQFDVQRRILLHHMRMKEKHPAIIIAEQSPFFLFNHRW